MKVSKHNSRIHRSNAVQPHHKPLPSPIEDADAVLHHVARQGDGRDTFIAKIFLSKNKPVTLGRSSLCTYLINEVVVSANHCKINVVASSNGGILVCCKDTSSNGMLINGQKVKNTSIIVMDGDVLEIPQLTKHKFVCRHITKGEEYPPFLQFGYSLKSIGPYAVSSHCLGSGSYATVHLAFDTKEYTQLACKTIKMKRESDYYSLLKEVRILQKLDHPNINKVLWKERVGKSLHIFLQLCTAGDLFTYITTQPNFHLTEGEAKYIMYQVLKGLTYLHCKNISHRDLKPENLLLYTPGPYPFIQIADFGLARPKSWQETLNVAGTVSYLPPEGILALENKDMGYLGMPSDCWSSGVILFIMLSGRHPFDNGPSYESGSDWVSHNYGSDCSNEAPCSQLSTRTEHRIKRRIVNVDFCFQEDWWSKMRDAQDLITRLLSPDPEKRATVTDALQSSWFSQERHELERQYRLSILGGRT